jgi:hypothetical protein
MCSYSRKVLTLTHENESGTNHPNVNELGTSRHIQNTECNKSYNPLFFNDSFLFTSSSICQRFNSSKAKQHQPKGTNQMRISIHDVAEIELEAVASLPTCKTRTLTIRDAQGNKYEITLFADDADALQIKA